MPHARALSATSLAVLAALAATALARAQRPDQPSRPNVLLILADDLGFSDVGCYGGEIPTPNIDRLAADGARFEACYSSARCCPSRASLLTGLHPHQTGVGSFATRRPQEGWGPAYTGHLLDNCATLAELLGDAGYSTWMVGKWHLGIPGPIERGFQHYWGFADLLAYSADQWSPEEYVRLPEDEPAELEFEADAFYATDAFTDYALEFLDQARDEPDRPWFLYVAHSAPHFPVQAPPESIDRHVDTYRRGWDALRAQRFARQQELGLVPDDAELAPRAEVPVDRDDIANGYPGEQNPAWDELPEARREDLARRMATFAAMVEHVDDGVGRLLADLEAHGELDDTLIVFVSDNGACYEWGPFGFDGPSRRGETVLHEGDDLRRIGQPGTWQSYGSAWANLGNTPFDMYKHFCHEGGVRGPLLLHWPRHIGQQPAWNDTQAHLMDLAPTVLRAAGAEYPRQRGGKELTPLEGVSLLDVARGADTLPVRSLPLEHKAARGIRRGPWKLTWGKRQPDPVRWELYDLRTDPGEQHDLADERPELVQQLAAEWESWARRVGAEPFQHGDERPATRRIDRRPLEVSCHVDPAGAGGGGGGGGVLVAQGGRRHGFALHVLADGRPVFDLRRNGTVTRVAAPEPLRAAARLTARADGDELTLAIDGDVVARTPSPGLLPAQPKDPLDVGRDTLTPAGRGYDSPHPWSGTIDEVRVEPGARVDRAPAPPSYGRADPTPRLPAGSAPLFDHWLRDTYVTRGPDDDFYLTGTTATPGRDFAQSPHCWDWNDGIYLWRSTDLEDWTALGRVWSPDDDPDCWQHGFAATEPFTTLTGERAEGRKRAVWAPELHYIESADDWFLVACMNDSAGGSGSFVLRSTSGAPTGPYANIPGNQDGPLFPRIDGSLFEDEDGSVWFIGHNHHYAPMRTDMTDLAGPVRRFVETPYDPEPYCEGAFVLRHAGRYHLVQAIWSWRLPDGTFTYRADARARGGQRWSYDCVIASSAALGGPYGPRYTAGVGIGHNNLFRDADGAFHATLFGNPRSAPDFEQPFVCRPGTVPMDWDGSRFRIAE